MLKINIFKQYIKLKGSGVLRKKFRGFKVMAGLVGDSGAETPRTLENFRKFAKMHYFSLFFKRFSKQCVKFLSVWKKNTIGWEIFEKYLMKMQ